LVKIKIFILSQIYHSFHDEVKLYKQHWWKCTGPCQHRQPFYGLVKRSMNRAPGPHDNWWAAHQASCGGSYVKIKEPEGYGVKKKKEGNEHKGGPGICLEMKISCFLFIIYRVCRLFFRPQEAKD
jgi:hypothetical protein